LTHTHIHNTYTQLVVGDIVILSTGDIVSADGYALGKNDLAINEKMLTGETVNKKKVRAHLCAHMRDVFGCT
jgi:P-type E1-E2 ATPase